MTRLMYPPQLESPRDQDRFDPIIEGARHGLSREVSLAIWTRACADATDGAGRRDEQLTRKRFHELAAQIAARGGRLRPDPGRVTRVGVEMRGESPVSRSAKELEPRVPGRETLVLAETLRPAVPGELPGEIPTGDASKVAMDATWAVAPKKAHKVLERSEMPGSKEVARMIAALRTSPRADVAMPPLAGNAPNLDEYLMLGLKAVLLRLGPNGRLRQEIIAAANPIRSIAGTAWQREPLPRNPTTDGDALWRVAERHAATLYRRASSNGAFDETDPAVESALRRRDTGRPLPTEIRQEMERELGVSLAGVHIHTDAVAADAARALGAEAFTVGEDIFFAEGAFEPATPAGRKLLAHELAHVAQALRGETRLVGDGLRVSQPGDPLEEEAEAVAEHIARAQIPARSDQVPLTAEVEDAHDGDTAGSRAVPPFPSPAELIQRTPTRGSKPITPSASLAMKGTTAQITILGQLVATVEFPATATEKSVKIVDLWISDKAQYALSIECSFEGALSLYPEGLAVLAQKIPNIQGMISARRKSVEAPYELWMTAMFGRDMDKLAAASRQAPAAATPPPPAAAAPSNSGPKTSSPAPSTKSDNTIDEPGLAESLIPIWGSGKSAIHHFQKGNVGRGILYTALAVSDVFLVKALATAGAKLIIKGGATVLAKEAAATAGKELATEGVAAVSKEGAEVISKETAGTLLKEGGAVAEEAAGAAPKLLGQGVRRFAGDEAVQHFSKHANEVMTALGKKSYTLAQYLDDANHVIQTGQWVPELNAYVKLVGGPGSAKAAFVGINRATGAITTFHIKAVKELARKAPSLGWIP